MRDEINGLKVNVVGDLNEEATRCAAEDDDVSNAFGALTTKLFRVCAEEAVVQAQIDDAGNVCLCIHALGSEVMHTPSLVDIFDNFVAHPTGDPKAVACLKYADSFDRVAEAAIGRAKKLRDWAEAEGKKKR